MDNVTLKSLERELAWAQLRLEQAKDPKSESASKAFGKYIDADHALREAREIHKATGRRIRAFAGKLR